MAQLLDRFLISQDRGLPVTEAELTFVANKLSETVLQKPYTISGPLPPEREQYRTNIRDDPHLIKFRDVRGVEGEFDVQKNGFMFARHPTKSCLKTLDEETVIPYLQEITTYVKDLFKAEHGFCYAYKFRFSHRKMHDPSIGTGTRDIPDEPAPRPHIDHTRAGGPVRIGRHLSDEERATYFDGSWRLRIITAWRPINGSVENYPLAVCNAFSIDQDLDLVSTDRVNPKYVGEVYYLRHNAQQDWYWLSGQTTEEMTIFVSFDSHKSFGPAFIPHGTFQLPNAARDARPRESLEVRIILMDQVEKIVG